MAICEYHPVAQLEIYDSQWTQLGSERRSQSYGALSYPPGCRACWISENELSEWAAGIWQVHMLQSLLELFQAQNSALTLHPTIQSCAMLVPNHRWGNWGWETLGNVSQVEWPAHDRLWSYTWDIFPRYREQWRRIHHPTPPPWSQLL